MNIGNVGSSSATDKTVAAVQGLDVQKKTRTDTAPVAEDSQKTTTVATTTEKTAKDVFVASKESNRVQNLTKSVENMTETVREDRVSQAQERVKTGYYNTNEFAQTLANKIFSETP